MTNDRLLGVLSMTPLLWTLLEIQGALLLAALALCFAPKKTAVGAKRLLKGNTWALVLSMATSALFFCLGYVQAFAAPEGPPSERARVLATGILTYMNATVLGVLFAIVLGVLLKVQSARGRLAS